MLAEVVCVTGITWYSAVHQLHYTAVLLFYRNKKSLVQLDKDAVVN